MSDYIQSKYGLCLFVVCYCMYVCVCVPVLLFWGVLFVCLFFNTCRFKKKSDFLLAYNLCSFQFMTSFFPSSAAA